MSELTFDSWEEETQALRERLVHEREALERNIESYTKTLDNVKRRLERLDIALGDREVKGEAPKRDRGVLAVVRSSVLPEICGWTLDSVVEAVRRIKPNVKVSSVRSALARLTKDGLVLTVGDRGSRLYYRVDRTESDRDPAPDASVGGTGCVEPLPSSLIKQAEKVSLKSTHVKGTMLFGGAEMPEHL